LPLWAATPLTAPVEEALCMADKKTTGGKKSKKSKSK
jgi:hypothetical protein